MLIDLTAYLYDIFNYRTLYDVEIASLLNCLYQVLILLVNQYCF